MPSGFLLFSPWCIRRDHRDLVVDHGDVVRVCAHPVEDREARTRLTAGNHGSITGTRRKLQRYIVFIVPERQGLAEAVQERNWINARYRRTERRRVRPTLDRAWTLERGTLGRSDVCSCAGRHPE